MMVHAKRWGRGRLGPFLLLVTLVLTLQIPAAGDTEPAEAAPGEPALDSGQEVLAQRIFNDLISPCCWTTTVATHGSGAAPRIQAEVRQMIGRGMTRQQILDHYVAQYGERILAKPKKTGFNLAAYWVPYLAILIGAAVIVAVFRRRRAIQPGGAKAPAESKEGTATTVPSAAADGAGDPYRRRLEEELRRIS